MINRILVGAHYGLKDWIAQRATAVIMAIYTLILVGSIIYVAPTTYEAWHSIFSCGFIKLATFVFFLSLFYHAWIGVRDIWMDYVQCTALRLSLHVLTIVLLVGDAGWMASILWRV